jgi:hypothetical protein
MPARQLLRSSCGLLLMLLHCSAAATALAGTGSAAGTTAHAVQQRRLLEGELALLATNFEPAQTNALQHSAWWLKASSCDCNSSSSQLMKAAEELQHVGWWHLAVKAALCIARSVQCRHWR